MESDKLQRTESLLRLVEHAAFIGVWTLDLRSDEVEWSDQLAAIHDAQPGYHPPRHQAFDLYAPEWRDKVLPLVQACAATGEPFDEEMQIVTLSGRRAWVRTLGHAVRDAAGADKSPARDVGGTTAVAAGDRHVWGPRRHVPW